MGYMDGEGEGVCCPVVDDRSWIAWTVVLGASLAAKEGKCTAAPRLPSWANPRKPLS
jgi:hypothetical protein